MLHHDSPAFTPGTVWNFADGTPNHVTIVSVKVWPRVTVGRHWHYDVSYLAADGRLYEKDLWNFQVRYCPQTQEV